MKKKERMEAIRSGLPGNTVSSMLSLHTSAVVPRHVLLIQTNEQLNKVSTHSGVCSRKVGLKALPPTVGGSPTELLNSPCIEEEAKW